MPDAKPKRVRADHRLVSLGLAESGRRARALILAGEVFDGTARIEKPGQMIKGDSPLRVTERPRYVGRGGEKLAGALEEFGLDVSGLTALDIGASTGGFTDCLLQQGAARVYAVDVGRGQLAERLRNDPRVVSMERTNARDPYALPQAVDLVVADVSFISLRLVLPQALTHLKPRGLVLAMVKPQFEAGREQVGRRGVVRDPAVHGAVVGGFCLWAIGLQEKPCLLGIRRSRLEGDEGNREFFVLLALPPLATRGQA
jgi:23S rRNA (cytidine1920-2'-O)/16S rRNA (cytidine1409-2'-O)-methyltransferase